MKAMGQIITHYSSPLGAITLAGESEFLTGLWFDGQKHFAETLPLEHREGALPVLEKTKQWLKLYSVLRSGRFCGRSPADRSSPTDGSPKNSCEGESAQRTPHGRSAVRSGTIRSAF